MRPVISENFLPDSDDVDVIDEAAERAGNQYA